MLSQDEAMATRCCPESLPPCTPSVVNSKPIRHACIEGAAFQKFAHGLMKGGAHTQSLCIWSGMCWPGLHTRRGHKSPTLKTPALPVVKAWICLFSIVTGRCSVGPAFNSGQVYI